MKKDVKVIIEHAGNNFSAYVSAVDGIAVTGDSVDEIKSSMYDAICDYIQVCEDCNLEIPEQFKGDYELQFELDVCSFLRIYAGIFSKSGLEKLTGINQKQLWHYANGKSKPRQAQRLKIEEGLHRLGNELISLHL
jgi:predicted RNase H-like HicB family nuclease